MYDYLLVINTNLLPILNHFRDKASTVPKSLYLATPLAFNPPMKGFATLYHRK